MVDSFECFVSDTIEL